MKKRINHHKVSHVWFWGAIVHYNYNLLHGWGIHWLHAGPRGGILTRNSTNWKMISGLIIRTQNHQVFLSFRRLPRYLAGGVAFRRRL